MKLMISACLLGACCRYDGGTKEHPDIARLAQQHTLIPVCPEQLGGLPTPRTVTLPVPLLTLPSCRVSIPLKTSFRLLSSTFFTSPVNWASTLKCTAPAI